MIRAIRDLAHSQTDLSLTTAFERYCGLDTLSTQDEQFCYNTDSLRKDIFRLLNLGADEYRICKKVNSINPDFCSANKQKASHQPDKNAIYLNERRKIGVIYM